MGKGELTACLEVNGGGRVSGDAGARWRTGRQGWGRSTHATIALVFQLPAEAAPSLTRQHFRRVHPLHYNRHTETDKIG